jgi:hypothetical protein
MVNIFPGSESLFYGILLILFEVLSTETSIFWAQPYPASNETFIFASRYEQGFDKHRFEY